MACRLVRNKEGKIDKVLAENGKPSKLYKDIVQIVPEFRGQFLQDPFIRRALSDGRIKDTSGEELALGLYAKFDSPEFKKWLGENKVVDSNGEPKLLFHGSLASFEEFNKDFSEKVPIFFTDDLQYAIQHGIKLRIYEEVSDPIVKYPVVVRASNLIQSEFWMNTADAKMQLEKTGADAVEGKEQDATDVYSIAVANPNQVKSIFNLGSFDNSNNIYFHLGDNPHNSDVDISEKLLPLVSKFGISIQSIQDYADRHNITLPQAATALADPFRKVIAIAEGKMNSNVLAEEFGHIVIDNTPQSYELERALKYVGATAEYKEALKDYGEVYKDDTKVRKEALGKLLGAHIIKNIERQGDNGLIRMLRRIWNNFLDLFRKPEVKELREYLDGITQKILGERQELVLQGDLLVASPTIKVEVNGHPMGSISLKNNGDLLRVTSIDIADRGIAIQALKDLGEQAHVMGMRLYGRGEYWESLAKQGNAEKYRNGYVYKPVGIYFNLQERNERDKLLSALEDSLLRRIKSLRKRQIDTESTIKQKRAVAEEKTLEGAEAGKGIATFLGLLNQDSTEAIQYIISTVRSDRTEEYLTGGIVPKAEHVDPQLLEDKKLDQLGDFVYYYKPYLIDLENYLGNKDTDIPENVRKQLLEITRQEMEKFRRIEAFRNNVREVAVENIFRTAMIQELNIDPNSQNIDEQITQKLGYNWKDNLGDYHKDTPQLEYWFGSMRDATDQILRAVHALLARITQRVHNHTIAFGKEVIDKATELGVAFRNANWAYETKLDENGKKKYTGNYIAPYKLAEWKEAFNKFREELHETFNVPEDYEERREMKDFIRGRIQAQLEGQPITAEEEFMIKQYKAYNAMAADWFARNTIPVPNAADIIAQRRRELSDAEFKVWYGRNVGTSLNKKGEEFKYYKGELAIPSDGSTRISAYNGVAYKTVDYSNPDWAALTDNQRTFMNWLFEKKAAIEASLPVMTQVTRAPQLTEGMMDIFFQKKGNILRRLGQEIKEGFRAPLEEDYLTGEDVERRPDGSVVRYVPLRFISELEDTDRISTDLLGGFIAYAEMVENFKQKTKELPKFNLIQEQLANRRFQDVRRKKAYRGAEKLSYKYLENFLDMNLSDQRKDNIEWGGINWTKALNNLANYVRTLNLGWNLFTQTSNMLSSQGFSLVETFVNEHFGPKDMKWAMGEFRKNLREVSMLDPVQKNKMALLMQYMGLSGDPRQFFDNLDKSKLVRKKGFVGDPFFGYEFGDFVAKAPVMLAVLHNYRMKDGRFYSRREYTGTDFDSLPTAWDTIQVDANGKLQMNMSEDIFNRVAGRVRYLSDQIDGKLSPLDYAAIQRHAVFSMILIHRNWLIAGVQKRFKKRGYNFMTGVTEEGHYNVVWKGVAGTVRKLYFSENRMADLRSAFSNWSELDPIEKKAILRVVADMAFATMAIAVAVILNNIADGEDDDDYMLNLTAYMGNRLALEAGAFFNPKELATVVESPFVPLRIMEYSFDVMDLLDPSEIESGPWEGWSKRQRFFMRLLPGVKFAQIAADPGATNQFLKSRPLKMVYDFNELLTGE